MALASVLVCATTETFDETSSAVCSILLVSRAVQITRDPFPKAQWVFAKSVNIRADNQETTKSVERIHTFSSFQTFHKDNKQLINKTELNHFAFVHLPCPDIHLRVDIEKLAELRKRNTREEQSVRRESCGQGKGARLTITSFLIPTTFTRVWQVRSPVPSASINKAYGGEWQLLQRSVVSCRNF